MNDVLCLTDFLDADACAALRATMRDAAGDAATVSGVAATAQVAAGVRRATQVALPAPEVARVTALLEGARDELATHFDRPLGALEPLQALRYRAGDFFVAHQDGNTPMIHDDTRHRRVSVVLLLSEPRDYTGGALMIHDAKHQRRPVVAAAGTLVAYRAETTHEVTPLTSGERYTIVSWFRAA